MDPISGILFALYIIGSVILGVLLILGAIYGYDTPLSSVF